MRRFAGILLIFLTFTGCEEQFGSNNEEAPQEIVDASLQLFLGSVINNATVVEDGREVWKVSVSNNEGSIVSFFWQKNFEIIYKIKGESGPFQYDLQPPLNVLPLSTARFLAFEFYSSKALDAWSLERSKSNRNRWVYRFYIQESESPLALDAASGDTVQD